MQNPELPKRELRARTRKEVPKATNKITTGEKIGRKEQRKFVNAKNANVNKVKQPKNHNLFQPSKPGNNGSN
jgi:hypothetical protein